MRVWCGLNVIPHWMNRSSTLAVQKIFNGNKYITPKYKYNYFTYKYKYSKNVLKYKYPISAIWVFVPPVCPLTPSPLAYGPISISLFNKVS